MSPNAKSNAAAVADDTRDILATRVFDAPRELVWKLWTEPEHIARWWGPTGFRNTIDTMDVRAGGEWRFIMHGPDGTDYKNHIVYREVVKPSLLRYTHLSGPVFDATVHFTERGEQTEVSVQMQFESAELRNRVAEEFGAVDGLQQTLGRLADQLKEKKSVSLTREFDAPREMVFHAFTDAKALQQWWGPKYFTNPVCEADARPGGAIRIDMQGPDGTLYPMTGVFHEVSAPERIVFSATAMDGALETMNILTFADNNGKTLLRLHAVVVKAEPEAANAIAGMEEGWKQSLERLADRVEDFVITREFDAPRDLMFRVWTECAHLSQWWGPKGFTVFHCNVDLRPGGTFHYGMRAPNDGPEMWGKFVYQEVTRPERLVYLVSFSDANGGVTRHPMAPDWPLEMKNTVTFEEKNGKTVVTLRGSAYNASEKEAATFHAGHMSMEGGYGGTMKQLEEYLATLN